MFGSSKKVTSYVGEMETIIGKDTMIKGTITGKGALRIDGQFEGDINTTGSIVIGEDAKVTAQCKGANATIAGIVYGNIDISEKLELLPSSQIYGDIKAGILSVGEGAVFKGACEMRHNNEISPSANNEVKK
jgi:cytoskeletal protein CcmA (bactofilin family)